MADYGSRVADAAIKSVYRKLRRTYGISQKELEKKLQTFVRKFEAKDSIQRQRLSEGIISTQQYKDWLSGQVFMRRQWESKIKEVTQVMKHSNEEAVKVINQDRLDVFSENYNYNAFLGEQQLGISFDVYNTQSVARLIKDDPQILPEWKINEKKDYEWNYKKVNNIVQQGIIQGEGVREISKRLCRDLSTQNENKMKMFARTAITGAQNAGRQQQMNDAADMGIDVHKQWLATLDSRTRDSHRHMDGEEVPYNEDFSNGLEYPGDPSGDPAEIYNCRCTVVTVYPKYDHLGDHSVRRAYEGYDTGEERTSNESFLTNSVEAYRKWKEGKQKWGFTSSVTISRISKGTGSISTPIGSRSGVKGRASAVTHFGTDLNERQKKLLEQLDEYDKRIEVKKSDVSMADLAALTAKTGVEFAMFTRKGKRLIVRGNEFQCEITTSIAKELRRKGYKWSGHTHPGNGRNVLLASEGDIEILKAFKQKIGCIWGETGNFILFDSGEDLL